MDIQHLKEVYGIAKKIVEEETGKVFPGAHIPLMNGIKYCAVEIFTDVITDADRSGIDSLFKKSSIVFSLIDGREEVETLEGEVNEMFSIYEGLSPHAREFVEALVARAASLLRAKYVFSTSSVGEFERKFGPKYDSLIARAKQLGIYVSPYRQHEISREMWRKREGSVQSYGKA